LVVGDRVRCLGQGWGLLGWLWGLVLSGSFDEPSRGAAVPAPRAVDPGGCADYGRCGARRKTPGRPEMHPRGGQSVWFSPCRALRGRARSRISGGDRSWSWRDRHGQRGFALGSVSGRSLGRPGPRRRETWIGVMRSHRHAMKTQPAPPVNGHRVLPNGGHEFPHWWPFFLPAGGHEFSHQRIDWFVVC
jgi:hypothetical protein